MSWTHVLAFGLGAMWMLIVFVTASAMRTPRRNWVDDNELHVTRTWSDLQAEAAGRYYD